MTEEDEARIRVEEDKEKKQRIAQWAKEAEERHKRRPKDHNMSREEIEERNKSPHFQKALKMGKSSEKYVAERLINIKFDVQDISEEKFEGRGNGLFHSPFDLLVTSQFYRFVVDVKRRNYRVPIGIPVKKLDDYESYSKYNAKDRMLIFHFPIRRGHEDCLFIYIKDIRERCHIVGPFYHIELHMLTTLTQKALLNTLEPIIRLDEILEKYESEQ